MSSDLGEGGAHLQEAKASLYHVQKTCMWVGAYEEVRRRKVALPHSRCLDIAGLFISPSMKRHYKPQAAIVATKSHAFISSSIFHLFILAQIHFLWPRKGQPLECKMPVCHLFSYYPMSFDSKSSPYLVHVGSYIPGQKQCF